MIGRHVRRKADKAEFVVSGQTGDGKWVLTPVEFGPSVAVAPSELRSQFGTRNVEQPKAVDQAGAWKKLAAAFERATVVAARRNCPVQPTPEEQLSPDWDQVAKRHAQEIAADEDRMAEFEAGLLPVHPAVERELDRIAPARRE